MQFLTLFPAAAYLVEIPTAQLPDGFFTCEEAGFNNLRACYWLGKMPYVKVQNVPSPRFALEKNSGQLRFGNLQYITCAIEVAPGVWCEAGSAETVAAFLEKLKHPMIASSMNAWLEPRREAAKNVAAYSAMLAKKRADEIAENKAKEAEREALREAHVKKMCAQLDMEYSQQARAFLNGERIPASAYEDLIKAYKIKLPAATMGMIRHKAVTIGARNAEMKKGARYTDSLTRASYSLKMAITQHHNLNQALTFKARTPSDKE